jgi:N-acetylglucosamine-6-phosphate deacetylase
MTLYTGLDLLDGDGLRPDTSLRLENGRISSVGDAPDAQAVDLSRDGTNALICPGFIDLQVNGGGGLMLGECQTVANLATLVSAHRRGGTVGLLPTLISDTARTTARIIELAADACGTVPGLLGLHLEGPHLAIAGAHDPALLRPMAEADLALYLDAAQRVPHLMITLAPEQATPAQIATLAEAGVCVSLGHSGCDYDMACAAFDAGARGVTHLFNAMSGLHHREPGLVGAALDRADVIGVIADGVHVHPAALRLAMRARPEAICLVSDAMAVAGTGLTGFELSGRTITRSDGRLTLDDGTLAGADLTQARAVEVMTRVGACDPFAALKAAFDTPHRVLTGQPNRIVVGQRADLLQVHGPVLRAVHCSEGWQTP